MPLAADAVAALTAKGLTLVTAEATTGGPIGYLLTEITGSSRVFRGRRRTLRQRPQAGDRRAGHRCLPSTALSAGKPPKRWIAVANAGRVRSERFVFEGHRSDNRRACAEAAPRLPLDALSKTWDVGSAAPS